MTRHPLLLTSSLAALLTASPAAQGDVPKPARIEAPVMVIFGSYDIVMRLPVTAGAGPAVPADQVCGLVELQLGTLESKVCRMGPVSRSITYFKSSRTQRVQGVYDAQAHSCRARGDIARGSYDVQVRYLTSQGQNPPTWNPPMTSPIENISTSGRITINSRQTTTLQLNLTRQESINPPAFGC